MMVVFGMKSKASLSRLTLAPQHTSRTLRSSQWSKCSPSSLTLPTPHAPRVWIQNLADT
uniref:Uncharacterized protein n=1 Tax=Anguilla anguilla TaxID=7936 RepID=A0A0E9WCF0_ANGAN